MELNIRHYPAYYIHVNDKIYVHHSLEKLNFIYAKIPYPFSPQLFS